jgi:hypothetical protein
MSKTSGLKELYTAKIGCFHQTPPGKTPFFYEVFWERKSNATKKEMPADENSVDILKMQFW